MSEKEGAVLEELRAIRGEVQELREEFSEKVERLEQLAQAGDASSTDALPDPAAIDPAPEPEEMIERRLAYGECRAAWPVGEDS